MADEGLLGASAEAILYSAADEIARLRRLSDDLLAALQGVVRVADRRTDEFDAAHAAIAKAMKQGDAP
jgi:hypothetical protein